MPSIADYPIAKLDLAPAVETVCAIHGIASVRDLWRWLESIKPVVDCYAALRAITADAMEGVLPGPTDEFSECE